MSTERKIFVMNRASQKSPGSGSSLEYPEYMRKFRVPFAWEKQPDQIKQDAIVAKKRTPYEEMIYNNLVNGVAIGGNKMPEDPKQTVRQEAETSSLQSKNEALQKRVETLEKRIEELERMKTEKETKSPEETIDLKWTNSSKMRDRQRIAEQLSPQNAKKVVKTELEKSEAVRKATDALERVNREREERTRQEINQRKIEPIAQSTAKAEAKPTSPKELKFTGEYFEKDGKVWGRAKDQNVWYPLEKVERPNEEAIKRDQEYRDNVRTKDVPEKKAERKAETPQPKTADELREEYQALIKRAQEIEQEFAQMEQAKAKPATSEENVVDAAKKVRPEAEDKTKTKTEADEESPEMKAMREKEEKRRKLEKECKEKLEAAEKKGKEDGEKAGREKLLAEIKKEDEEKKNKNIFRRFGKFIKRHKKVILAGAVGAAVVLATWATMQYFGYFLPFSVPIKEILLNGVPFIR